MEVLGQEADTSHTQQQTIWSRLKTLLSPFGESEDDGLGIQFISGEGMDITRSFYLPGPEATLVVTTYQAQGVLAPFSTYDVISEDGYTVINNRFSIQSDFPKDEVWEKSKSSHEEKVILYGIRAGMYHIKVQSRLRWRITVYPYRMD